MGRKGESIYKRKDGRYEGRYIKEYKNGKAIYGYVYAKTYSLCKKKKNFFIINKNNIQNINKRIVFQDLNFIIDKWLKNKKIKESSYSFYYNIINQHIKDNIGKIKINKINSKLINNYLNNLLNKGRLDNNGGLSNNYVYIIRSILNQVFNENNIKINIMKLQLSKKHGKILNINEKEILIKELINKSNNISIGILLSLFLGLRKAEVCGIRICDIDLNNKILKINNIISKVKSFNTKNKTKLIITKPKTNNSIGILPIPDKLISLLSKINFDNKNNFLLTNSTNFMDPRTFYNKYKKIILNLNMNYTYHDLRHTFATNVIEKGIDYKSLMEILGHSSINTTMNIYVHPTLKNKRNYINKL